MTRAANLTTARKTYTCDFCEKRIEQGERYAAVTLFPGMVDVDQIMTHRSHALCSDFWMERLYPEYGPDEPVWDWDEAKREFGWDEWLAARS